MLRLSVCGACLALGLCSQVFAQSTEDCTRALGETIYVPAFSHVFTHENRRQPLASTLVVHNVDPAISITLTRVELFDESGDSIRTFTEEPSNLEPFASSSFLTELNDSRGGIGANYLIEWVSDASACVPISLAVMVGGNGTHGISFSVEGQTISRTVE